MDLEFVIETVLSFCEGDYRYVCVNQQWIRIYKRMYRRDVSRVDFDSLKRVQYAVLEGYAPTRWSIIFAAYSNDIDVLPYIVGIVRKEETFIPASILAVLMDIPRARDYFLCHEMDSIRNFFNFCLGGQLIMSHHPIYYNALEEVIRHSKSLPEDLVFLTLNARDDMKLLGLCLERGSKMTNNIRYELGCIYGSLHSALYF